MAWLAFALVKAGLKKQRSPETLQQTGFPDFVEGAELLFCQTSNILADAVHLTEFVNYNTGNDCHWDETNDISASWSGKLSDSSGESGKYRKSQSPRRR